MNEKENRGVAFSYYPYVPVRRNKEFSDYELCMAILRICGVPFAELRDLSGNVSHLTNPRDREKQFSEEDWYIRFSPVHVYLDHKLPELLSEG